MKNASAIFLQWPGADLRRPAVAISLLFSAWIILTNDTLNTDGTLYLSVAYNAGNLDWKSATDIPCGPEFWFLTLWVCFQITPVKILPADYLAIRIKNINLHSFDCIERLLQGPSVREFSVSKKEHFIFY